MRAQQGIGSRQPGYNAGIDWSNPLTNGLTLAYNFAVGPVNQARPVAPGTSGTALSYVGDYRGRSSSWARTTANPVNTNYAPGTITAHSCVALINFTNLSGANPEAIIDNRVSANNGFVFWARNALGSAPNRTFTLAYTLGAVADYLGTVAISGFDNSWGVVGFSATPTGGTVRAFANGTFIESAAIGSIGNNADTLRIAQDVFFAQNPANYNLAMIAYWSRALTDGEHTALAVAPYCLFTPQRPQRVGSAAVSTFQPAWAVPSNFLEAGQAA